MVIKQNNITDVAIKLENVTKEYKLYDKPVDRLKESIFPWEKTYSKSFYAVNNVTFEVEKGQALGIIGKNGSGKSTLLKMITGVLTPSSGRISINGKISALLELGAGFNPDFTGLENIYLNATIMGYKKEQIDQKLEDILSFAELGDFINQPVKLYSSGMFVRLAFAVSIHVDPDILIIDEALSVGDMRFQQKCFRKMEQFKKAKTLLFVSHDLSVINKFCDRVIWINDGIIRDDGSPEEVSKKYRAFMIGSGISRYKSEVSNGTTKAGTNNLDDVNNIDPIEDSLDVMGDNKAIIKGISIFDAETGQKSTILESGQKVEMIIKVKYNCSLRNPIVGFTLKDRLGNIVSQSNNYILNQVISQVKEGETFQYSFTFTLPFLKHGYYTISPAVASGSQEDHAQHCWIHDALVIQILDQQIYDLEGYLILPDVKFSIIE